MRAVLALIVLLAFAVAPGRALDGRQFRLHGGRLVDERRREVTLRGVNARVEGIFDVTFGDGRLSLEPIPVFDDGDAATMARFGLNLLRLPISWSGLEPVRGRFDTAYLDRIAAVVALCRAHGIVVLLDFHQDAFSKEIGEDGRRAGCSTSCSARTTTLTSAGRSPTSAPGAGRPPRLRPAGSSSSTRAACRRTSRRRRSCSRAASPASAGCSATRSCVEDRGRGRHGRGRQ